MPDQVGIAQVKEEGWRRALRGEVRAWATSLYKEGGMLAPRRQGRAARAEAHSTEGEARLLGTNPGLAAHGCWALDLLSFWFWVCFLISIKRMDNRETPPS